MLYAIVLIVYIPNFIIPPFITSPQTFFHILQPILTKNVEYVEDKLCQTNTGVILMNISVCS